MLKRRPIDGNNVTHRIGFSFYYGDKLFTWGRKEDGCYDGKSVFNRPVRSIEWSDVIDFTDMKGRNVKFYDEYESEMGYFTVSSSCIPESLPGRKFKFPEGYELIGFNIARSLDNTIDYITFSIW